jgi:hypothetical protein
MFLILSLHGGELSASSPLPPSLVERALRSHCIRGQVGPIADLNAVPLLTHQSSSPYCSHYADLATGAVFSLNLK